MNPLTAATVFQGSSLPYKSLWHSRSPNIILKTTLLWNIIYQFIEYHKGNIKTDFLDITCGVHQGSIFGSFAFYHFCVSN